MTRFVDVLVVVTAFFPVETEGKRVRMQSVGPSDTTSTGKPGIGISKKDWDLMKRLHSEMEKRGIIVNKPDGFFHGGLGNNEISSNKKRVEKDRRKTEEQDVLFQREPKLNVEDLYNIMEPQMASKGQVYPSKEEFREFMELVDEYAPEYYKEFDEAVRLENKWAPKPKSGKNLRGRPPQEEDLILWWLHKEFPTLKRNLGTKNANRVEGNKFCQSLRRANEHMNDSFFDLNQERKLTLRDVHINDIKLCIGVRPFNKCIHGKCVLVSSVSVY
jgi:hypothetical protein